MRKLSWIIQVGLKPKHKYLYKRETERDMAQTEEERAMWPQSTVSGDVVTTKEWRQPPAAEWGKEWIPPNALRKWVALTPPWFQPSKINFGLYL